MITIELNGERRELPEGSTVASLLETLSRDPRTVAVEHNGDILPRSSYASTPLAAGDHLEIVAFVQGG